MVGRVSKKNAQLLAQKTWIEFKRSAEWAWGKAREYLYSLEESETVGGLVTESVQMPYQSAIFNG